MKRITLIKTNCHRCNKELMTASESLYGLNEEKQKFGTLCKSCVSHDEKMQIHEVIGNKILEKVGK